MRALARTCSVKPVGHYLLKVLIKIKKIKLTLLTIYFFKLYLFIYFLFYFVLNNNIPIVVLQAVSFIILCTKPTLVTMPLKRNRIQCKMFIMLIS